MTTELAGRSNCPISPDFADCRQPCAWYVEAVDDDPGGCVVVVILRRLVVLSARLPRRPGRPPGKRPGPPWQGPV